MNANARTVAVAVVCLLALGLAAATLPNPDPMTGGGAGTGPGSGGLGSGNPGFLPGQHGSASTAGSPFGKLLAASGSLCYPFLTTGAFYLSTIFAALVVLGLVYWRTNGYVTFVVAVLFGIPLVFVHALLTSCGFDSPASGPGGGAAPQNGSRLAGGGGGGLGPAAAHVTATNPILLALAVVVLAAAAVVLFRSTGDDEETETVEPPAPPSEDLEAVGRVAGDAADRIESDGDVENEVYRAWRELTGLLDVDDPATTTPAEFADAARDAGMHERDVRTLTELFRDVRYGGADPDADDRSERAVAALRGIENAYGDEERSEDSRDGESHDGERSDGEEDGA